MKRMFCVMAAMVVAGCAGQQTANTTSGDGAAPATTIDARAAMTSLLPVAREEKWEQLFNGKDLTGFYTVFKTAKRAADGEGYFKVETVDGEPAVHVMGFPVLETKRDFGYFVTEKAYGNFDLVFQYKWGEKKHPPRQKAKRDAGCIYFVNGMDQVWPDGVECQVQEGDTGDVWIVNKNISVDATVKDEPANSKGEFTFSPTGKTVTVSKTQKYKDATQPAVMKDVDGRIVQQGTADGLTGWNTVEVIAKGNAAVYIVNGRMVNRLSNMRLLDSGLPLDHGKILFQAEGSEVYYRGMRIRELGMEEKLPVTQGEVDGRWKVNDRARPRPGRVEPEGEEKLKAAGKAPADAVILFGGNDLSAWRENHWKVSGDAGDPWMELVAPVKAPRAAGTQAAVKAGSGTPKYASMLSPEELAAKGNLVSTESFGSCKVHVEFMCPNPPKGKDQAAANSGVYMMCKYEMQVLDNTNNPTYADGLAGAVYGENPPLWEASRGSGEWNYYDIEWHRPVFGSGGKLERAARVTMWLNGVKVQDDFELSGPTEHEVRLPYVKHEGEMPLMLQNHGQVCRYRNVWVERIAD